MVDDERFFFIYERMNIYSKSSQNSYNKLLNIRNSDGEISRTITILSRCRELYKKIGASGA